jgi:protein phosphatase 1G
MGVHLSTPKTEKYSQDGEGGGVRYGLASMQGWRTTMEDAVSFPRAHHPLPYSLCSVSR